MWRLFRRFVIGLVGLVIAALLAGVSYDWFAARRDLAATPQPGRLVDVGGHRLHIWCTGEGSPAVILESGLGGWSVDWGFVQPEVARVTRVCSYDRAGMGYSDAGPSPRTARRIAHELAALVDRAGIAGPLVLVGASSGGLSVRMFASEHEERVAGLVLVDASHEDQSHEVPSIAPIVPLASFVGLLRLLGVSFSLNPESLAPAVQGYARAMRFRGSGYRAAASELVHFPQSATEVRTSRRLLQAPVVVVSGGLHTEETWHRLQRDQVGLSPRGCQIIAERSGHLVMVQQPQAVVDAVRGVVDTARGKNVALCGAAATAR